MFNPLKFPRYTSRHKHTLLAWTTTTKHVVFPLKTKFRRKISYWKNRVCLSSKGCRPGGGSHSLNWWRERIWALSLSEFDSQLCLCQLFGLGQVTVLSKPVSSLIKIGSNAPNSRLLGVQGDLALVASSQCSVMSPGHTVIFALVQS